MKINRNELQEALTIVKPGLSNKEILEQTTSFAFLNGRVVTYNDEISISHPIKGINFEGTVKAEELYGLLTRLSKDEVELDMVEDELQIRCGRLKAGLKLEEEIQLPLRTLPKEWEKLKHPEQFKDFMSLAMQTCSTDMSKPKLTCVCVRSDGAIIGSDGYRLVRCQGHGSPVDDFLIPATSVNELLKIKPTYIQLEKTWIHFKNDRDTVFSCRCIDQEYVPQDRIEESLKMDKKEEIIFPRRIEAILDRGRQFAKRGFSFDEIVEIVIEDGKLLMKAVAQETKSWIEEEATIKSNATITFMITPALFENILKMTRTCILDKGMRKVKFTMEDKNGGDCEYLIMLAE